MRTLSLNNGPNARAHRFDLTYILNRQEPFQNHGASLRGECKRAGYQTPTAGWLNEKPYRESLLAATYVVYSYATPIAWCHVSPEHCISDAGFTTSDGTSDALVWTMPDVKYSATTSRHQSIIRGALSNAL